jgi:hypothetical protein
MHVLAQAQAGIEGAPLALAGFAALAALAYKIIDFLRMLASLPGTKSGVVTQLLAWIGAIGVLFLYAASQFGDTVSISNVTLDKMDTATKLLTGLALGSFASVIVDFRQAFDSGDSAAKPPLLK